MASRKQPAIPPTRSRPKATAEAPTDTTEPQAARDETPIELPTWQAQEIFSYLGGCPAGQVYNLIGYLLAASQTARSAG
jgi:hypothetical protein